MNRQERKIQEQLAIPTNLLDAGLSRRPWSNLGDWSRTLDYSAACHALACRVGRAAELGPSDTLLELACGYGASLDVWSEVFGVRVVDVIERQTRALASLDSDRPEALRDLWQADLNSILSQKMPWPKDTSYDAIVVVDAAYHFTGLRAFLEGSSGRLRSGGRLAFTTLVMGSNWAQAKSWQKSLVFKLAAGALIPAASLVAEEELPDLFGAAGFHALECENLDREVLEGFTRFVGRRRGELKGRERCSAGWWKVEATAAAARQLLRTGLLHYVLLKAVKS
ncbi:MAG TPA: methyltransferase domain-containing protein [Oligoflexus sp.]|uniref:SAM-dependent methyltransferase n=1 Tax=Oligoflexus sp. TaxID=1971216 RepID=UPI002D803AAD|nr:methyltransferase domain-containing protein [Oligoflexus sp.]HET9237833.1 methyltransferase domain-containing protein [Oligoflexus sp.]